MVRRGGNFSIECRLIAGTSFECMLPTHPGNCGEGLSNQRDKVKRHACGTIRSEVPTSVRIRYVLND